MIGKNDNARRDSAAVDVRVFKLSKRKKKEDDKQQAVLLELFDSNLSNKLLALKMNVKMQTVLKVKRSLTQPTQEQQEETERRTARKRAR